MPPAALTGTRILFAVGGLALWLVLYVLGLSALQEHHEQRVLYDRFRSELSQAVAPIGGTIPDGHPVALLDIPAAGIHNLIAVEGTTSADLRSGPGHLPGTVLPGQAGTATILGRAVAYAGPFRGIPSMHQGDRVTVTTGQGTFTYLVSDVRRPGDPITAVPAGGGRLTLVTADSSGWRSDWSPSRTVYVDATLTGKPATSSGVAATSVAADGVMKGDSSALVPLVLWLQGLTLAGLGFVWARKRWGPGETWLVAVPVLFACLWGASDSVMQLLPNLV